MKITKAYIFKAIFLLVCIFFFSCMGKKHRDTIESYPIYDLDSDPIFMLPDTLKFGSSVVSEHIRQNPVQEFYIVMYYECTTFWGKHRYKYEIKDNSFIFDCSNRYIDFTVKVGLDENELNRISEMFSKVVDGIERGEIEDYHRDYVTSKHLWDYSLKIGIYSMVDVDDIGSRIYKLDKPLKDLTKYMISKSHYKLKLYDYSYSHLSSSDSPYFCKEIEL